MALTVEMLAQVSAREVGAFVREQIALSEARLRAEMSVRLADAGMEAVVRTWRGVHDPARHYQPNDLVTCDNGLWFATAPTDRRPGTPDSGWKLAVKSPR